jgi:hypothetical protein
LVHWIDGGPTSLANTTLLCRIHHRAVHEGGFVVRREPDGRLAFFRPDGAPLVPAGLPLVAPGEADPLRSLARRWRDEGVVIDARTCMPRDAGSIDVGWAIDVLRAPASAIDGSPFPPPRVSTRGRSLDVRGITASVAAGGSQDASESTHIA